MKVRLGVIVRHPFFMKNDEFAKINNLYYNNSQLMGLIAMKGISSVYQNDKYYHLRYEFIKENASLIYIIKDILKEDQIFSHGLRFQSEEKGFPFSKIKERIKEKGINVSDKEILLVLQHLLITEQSIIRKEYWNEESTYILLDNHYQNSSLTRSHFSFEDGTKCEKRFILLSDTHIGNDDIECFEIINSLYNYGIINKIKYFFHLGDLFSKTNINEEEKLLKRFKDNYPNANEINTYALLGNHDERINEYIKENYCSDLRILMRDNNNFYMIPRNTWSHNFNNLEFHFSHRLYYNCLVNDLKMNGIEDLEKNKIWQGFEYDVLISGHLHKGLIYTSPNKFKGENNTLFLGVPSTSKINTNGIVAYDVTICDNEIINIKLLGVDGKNKIVNIEEITFNNKQKNNTYSKILK